MTTAAGLLLWLRALLVGTVTMVLGTTAHVTGGGRLPGVFAMSFLAVLLIASSAPLLRERAGWGRLMLLVGGGQFFLHSALTVVAGHRGDSRVAHASPPTGRAAELGALVVDGRRVGSLMDAYSATHQPSQHAPQTDIATWSSLVDHAPMTTLHLVAAAGVAGWLAHGERSLWTVLALLSRQLLLLWTSAPTPRGRPVPALPLLSATDTVRLSHLAACLVRRGPPRLLAL